MFFFFFFFNDTATTEIYTLSLHDALPISVALAQVPPRERDQQQAERNVEPEDPLDRKSTRLNSSHEWISYAVFCLKKKKKKLKKNTRQKYTRIRRMPKTQYFSLKKISRLQ